MDYSQINVLEVAGFENISEINDDGYIVLPRAVGFADYGLCLFGQHKEDFDVTLRALNMPIFGVKTKEQCFLAVVSRKLRPVSSYNLRDSTLSCT